MQVTYYCEDEEMVEQGNWWLFYCDHLNIFAYLMNHDIAIKNKTNSLLYRSFILHSVPIVSV